MSEVEEEKSEISALMEQVEGQRISVTRRWHKTKPSATAVGNEITGSVYPTLLRVLAVLNNQQMDMFDMSDRLDQLDGPESQLLPEDAAVLTDAIRAAITALAGVGEYAAEQLDLANALVLIESITVADPDDGQDQPAAVMPERFTQGPGGYAAAAAAPPPSPPAAAAHPDHHAIAALSEPTPVAPVTPTPEAPEAQKPESDAAAPAAAVS